MNTKIWFNGVEYDTQVCSEKTETGRGAAYIYALLKDGNVVTFGAEQGGYSGGIEAETPESIKKYCIRLKQSDNRISRSLYDALVQAGAKNIC